MYNMVFFFSQEFRKYIQELGSKALGPPNKDLHGDIKSVTGSILPSDGRPLRVFTDIPHVEEFLTRPEFVLSKFLIVFGVIILNQSLLRHFLYQQFI